MSAAERGNYHTKQRTRLADFFRQHPGESFTARELIERLAPDMGEATVYRALSGLVQQGILEKHISSGGASAYCINTKSGCHGHLHLQCLSCSEVICTDNAIIAQLDDSLDFEVDDSRTTIFGICAKCRNSNKEHRDE